MTKILILLPALLFNIAFTQNIQLKDIVGVYSDESIGFHMTELKLKDDYTFSLETIDPVFPYTHQYFKNYGKFKIVGDEVILNPDKTPRTKKLELIQSVETENEDSILIEINYFIEKYKNEKLIDKEQIEFELLQFEISSDGTYFSYSPDLAYHFFIETEVGALVNDIGFNGFSRKKVRT